MLRIKNTSTDRSKTLLHRKAAKLVMEPNVGGKRLFMNQSCDLPEEDYEKNKAYYDKLIADGTIEIVGAQNQGDREPKKNSQGLYVGGPTLEVFMAAGYKPENYPPIGWAEVPSPGLTAFRADQAAAKKAEDYKKELAEAQAKLAAEQVIPVEVIAPGPVEVEAPKLDLDEVLTPSESLTTMSEPAGVPAADPEPTMEQEQKRGPGRPKKKLF